MTTQTLQQVPKGILLLTGTLGSGKTTVATEVGRQLEEAGITSAVIDLDWLCWANLGDTVPDDLYDKLILQNLLTIWPNFRAVGVDYLVLPRGLLDETIPTALRKTFPETPISILRLHASHPTLEERLSRRDKGEILDEHLRECGPMTEMVENLKLEDAVVHNDGRSVAEVARQILDILGWK
ncbi:adenylyl-sulfate kinase [Chitinimonas sp. PSY-7]|uniref:adenylyl-sulfate kinase n=1 Tax=Chitinimonas sp. PSY-7 TaxID=3459088 RepID=UPI00403FEE84